MSVGWIKEKIMSLLGEILANQQNTRQYIGQNFDAMQKRSLQDQMIQLGTEFIRRGDVSQAGLERFAQEKELGPEQFTALTEMVKRFQDTQPEVWKTFQGGPGQVFPEGVIGEKSTKTGKTNVLFRSGAEKPRRVVKKAVKGNPYDLEEGDLYWEEHLGDQPTGNMGIVWKKPKTIDEVISDKWKQITAGVMADPNKPEIKPLKANAEIMKRERAKSQLQSTGVLSVQLAELFGMEIPGSKKLTEEQKNNIIALWDQEIQEYLGYATSNFRERYRQTAKPSKGTIFKNKDPLGLFE